MLWFFAPSHQPLRRSIVVDDTTLGSKERAGLWWWGLVKQGFLERYGAYSLHFEKGRGRKLEDDPFFLRWLFWKVLWYAMFASRVCIIYNQIIPFGDIYIYYQHIYWVTTRHAYDVVNYVSMGAYPDIFLPIVTLKAHNLCFKRHGSSTAWGAPNRNKLSTAGNHWFPLVPMQCWCKLILHRLPRCCVRDFPSRTEKAGWDPTIDKFPSAAWPFERRFTFVLLFDCFDVGMIHLRKMHWKCWSGWDGLI